MPLYLCYEDITLLKSLHHFWWIVPILFVTTAFTTIWVFFNWCGLFGCGAKIISEPEPWNIGISLVILLTIWVGASVLVAWNPSVPVRLLVGFSLGLIVALAVLFIGTNNFYELSRLS